MASDEDLHDPREVDSWLLTNERSREASLPERIDTVGATSGQDELLQLSGSQTFQPTLSKAEALTQTSQSSGSAGIRSPTARVAAPGPSVDQAWT